MTKYKWGKILLKTFFLFENTLYSWKYFVLNIWANSSYPSKLFCSPTAMSESLNFGDVNVHCKIFELNLLVYFIEQCYLFLDSSNLFFQFKSLYT